MSSKKLKIKHRQQKNIVLFLLLMLLAAAANPSLQQRNDLVKRGLKGEIKSIMETKYALVENEDPEDTLIVKDTVIYQKHTFFNEFGFETESRLYQNGSQVSATRYIFGPRGQQVEMNKYNEAGELVLNVKYRHDNKGYRVQGTYNWKKFEFYDELTELEEVGIEELNEDLVTRVIFNNNHRGLCEEERFMKADGCISYRNTYRYDFRDKVVEMTYYKESGRVAWRSKYKYSRYGHRSQSRLFKDNRIAIESNFEYEFDEAGNWISRYEDRKLIENILTRHLKGGNTLTERTIEYYQ
jgi:hypothetical protein